METNQNTMGTNRTARALCIIAATALALAATGCPEEESTPSTTECGSEALYSRTHDTCEPQDAAGDGQCLCMLGYIFDGEGCAMVGGCECVGADCDALFETEEECLAVQDSCAEPEPITCGSEELYVRDHDSCEAQDVAGEGECFCALGAYWDGDSCESLDGMCECVGTDCDALYETVEDCEAANEMCAESIGS